MSRIARGRLRPSWAALTWLTILVVALVAGVVLAASSDAGNTDVRTADPLVGSDAAPAEQVGELWSAAAVVDDQQTVAGDTVITSTAQGLRGLDPLTGEERWHYLRRTASMCDFTVLDDVVVAIFRTTGRCNEAVALEAGTGVRRWYRNVGFSDQLSLLGSGTAVLAATPHGIAVMDAVGNSIRWRYNPPQGCELSSIGIGNSGVVVLERCVTGTAWLAEFELYGGDQRWRVPPPPGDVTVIGAEGVVSLLVGQQLTILSAINGSSLASLSTEAGPGASAGAAYAGRPGGRGVPLVYLDGTLYAIDPVTGRLLWTVAAAGIPATSDFSLIVAEEGAFVVRSAETGEEISRSTVSGGDVDGLLRVEQVGPVVVAVSDGGITAYG